MHLNNSPCVLNCADIIFITHFVNLQLYCTVSSDFHLQAGVLSRNIKDLDDVRLSMKALSEIREQHIMIDMTLGPVEEAYGLLQKSQVSPPLQHVLGLCQLHTNMI